MVRPSHLGMMAAVLGLTLGPPCAAQEEGGIMKGRAFIPDTSLERPEHVGLRAHTNHRILVEPAGGEGPGEA